MATTQNNYTGNGSNKLFSITFPYLDTADIDVFLNGTLQTVTTQYTFANATTVEFVAAPGAGAAVLLKRSTDDVTILNTFFPGSSIKAADLNDNFDQALYLAQETNNNVANAVAGQIPDGTITSAKIANGAIINEDVNASAGITAGKLSFTQAGTGATARTIDSKLKDVVSVKDFGAVGDGTTDDTAAITAALAASDSIFIPAGTYKISSAINVTNKRIAGAGINRTALQLSGTNTATTLFYNNKTSSASWGTGGGLELRDITLKGNWDGSTALADNTWDNTAALLKLGAAAGVRLIDVQLQYSYGHNASFYRLGYATFTRVKVVAAKKNGLHFEAPSGSDSITSTQIQNCDLNSNRGVGNIYVKNGVGFWVNGNVFEDSLAGVYVDGNDNRNITIINNHCETNTNGLLHYVGSGLNTVLANNFGDAQITRTNPTFQTLFAHSNQGMFNGFEEGLGTISQSLLAITSALSANLESGNGTSTYANKIIGWFGTANYLDVVGRLSWRTNNNNNASEPMAQIKAVQRGNANQNWGALYLSTGKNGLVDRAFITEDGHLLPVADNTYSLGTGSNRWSVVYAGTGTINTSDEREKQDIATLDDAEKLVATALKGLIKKYRFKDAVQTKGDDARIHVGVIVQDVIAAFEAEGLDPLRYGIVCYDKWDAEFDADGNETRPAGDRYGIRYEELLAFIISAL